MWQRKNPVRTYLNIIVAYTAIAIRKVPCSISCINVPVDPKRRYVDRRIKSGIGPCIRIMTGHAIFVTGISRNPGRNKSQESQQEQGFFHNL
jgi:hypothetical protein